MNLTLFEKPKSLTNRLPELFNDFFNDDFPFSFRSISTTNLPPLNVIEGETETNLQLALPGIEKKDIKISIDQNVLTISSEQSVTKNDSTDKIVHREFGYQSFTRSFKLQENSSTDQIESKLENGILSIKIPKQPKKAAKLIDIQ